MLVRVPVTIVDLDCALRMHIARDRCSAHGSEVNVNHTFLLVQNI